MQSRSLYPFLFLSVLFLAGCAAEQIQLETRDEPVSTDTHMPSTSTPAVTSPTPVSGGTGWKLAFSDEFDDAGLNEDKWVTCYWWATDGCTIISNNELEWYQPGNVSIRDGRLILEAREQQVDGFEGNPYRYTSGMVTTGRATSEMEEAPRFAFQYGYVEIRAKIPAGQGVWPAFWMLPVTHESRPEIDILEILGHEPQTVKFYFHYFNSDGNRADRGGEWTGPDFSEDWHTYGLDWQPDRLIWYVDGVQRFEFDEAASVPAEPMYILLNLAVGGDWPGAPDHTTEFPSQYEIDYVRVFQH